jgi:ribosome-binding protein aMBF1 (putative translation factor)
MSHYPTQEDELRAREAQAETIKQTEEAKFLSTFQTIPVRNVRGLSEMAKEIVRNFNRIMEEARQEPYQRQEDIMAGMIKLLEEQINVIEARRAYTIKINPSTALKEEKKA